MNIITEYSKNQCYPKNVTKEINPQKIQPQEHKPDNKKLALTLGIIGAIGLAGIGAAIKIKKGQMPNPQDGVALLKQIKFEKGTATIKKTGNNFTGKIIDKLKNGDEIVLEYVDGKIKSSARKGKVNFIKTYTDLGEGAKKIVTESAGLTSIFKSSGNWHEIRENDVVVKEFFNRENNMVVNNFEAETGILTETTVFDKLSKKINKIKRNPANLVNASKIREQSANKIEYTVIDKYFNGATKAIRLEDGTIREFDACGNVIKETKNGIESVVERISKFDEKSPIHEFEIFWRGMFKNEMNINELGGELNTVSTFPDGTMRIFDKYNKLRFESLPNGVKKVFDGKGNLRILENNGKKSAFYPNGQLVESHINGIIKRYRENGTIEKETNQLKDTIADYTTDGINKWVERFEDGSWSDFGPMDF